jgi:hypothetical protein
VEALDWRRVVKTSDADKATGVLFMFYFNATTKTKETEAPACLFRAPTDLPLPRGWERAVDVSLNMPYYWQTNISAGEKQEATWEFPVETITEEELWSLVQSSPMN